MRAAALCFAAAAAICALGGCGGGETDDADPEEVDVLRTIALANESFAAGDYKRTCSYYSEELQRELARSAGVTSCPQSWAETHRAMRRALSDAEFDAVIAYGAESAEVVGERATARYGPPPPSLPAALGIVEGTTVELRREGEGRWVITTLPEVVDPGPPA